eukprot:Em0002g1365a
MGCGAGSDSQSRSADVLVPNWDLGKPAAFDLSVTSTLQSSALLEASVTAGSAAQLAENRKHNNCDKKCDELGLACIPLVVETYGCWGAEAVAALSKLAGRLSVRNNEQKSKTIFSLYSRLGLTLIVDFYHFRYEDTAMQSKFTFPTRIAPFSVPLGRMEAVQGLRKARFERETWTYFALLYLHNGRGSYLDFEPLGVLCLVTSARSKGKTPKCIFVERSGVARSVRNRKLIA